MRRTPAILAVLLLVGSLGLAMCGDDESGDAASGDSGDLPEVAGSYGETPVVDVPGTEPADDLVVDVVSAGDGPEVVEGDFLVANYHGQTWAPAEDGTANVFDSSFDRGQPAGFAIGVGQVIPGWDEGLVGQDVGSRVLLVIPPEQGYGAEGTADGSIPGDSTLVFVVDLIDTVPADAGVSGTPAPDVPDGLPTVTGEGAEAPTVTIAEGAEPPAESTATVLLEGDGEPLGDLLVVKVLQVSYATGETQFSSWDQSPTLLTAEQLPGLAAALEGQQVGTRALVQVAAADNPGADGAAGEPLALVVDVISTV